MNKRPLIIFTCIILTSLSCLSQTRSMKDLIGKWRRTSFSKNKDTSEFIFVDDTTFITKDTRGFYAYPNRYRFDFSQDAIILTSLRKNRNGDYATVSLKFIDDNTLIYKFIRAGSYDGTKDPKNAATTFTRVDRKDYSSFTHPTLLSLHGAWRYDRYTTINFIDDTTASVKDGYSSPDLYNYTVDFTKYPYRVDFTSADNKQKLQGLFIFPTDSTMVFEKFRSKKRKDDFTTFGRYIYLKIDSARKIRMLLKRAQQN